MCIWELTGRFSYALIQPMLGILDHPLIARIREPRPEPMVRSQRFYACVGQPVPHSL